MPCWKSSTVAALKLEFGCPDVPTSDQTQALGIFEKSLKMGKFDDSRK